MGAPEVAMDAMRFVQRKKDDRRITNTGDLEFFLEGYDIMFNVSVLIILFKMGGCTY